MVTQKVKVVLFWGGALVVIATHVYMLGFGLPEEQMTAHAVLNLAAIGAMLFARWK